MSNSKNESQIINNSGNLSSKNSQTNKFNFNAEIVKLPEDFSGYHLNYKVIVIGKSGVGKTCITNQAAHEEFLKDYHVTIGMEFFVLFVKIDDKIIKLQIWDTCGQEAYRSLVASFYRSVSLVFIVYAINSRDSFEDIDYWVKDLKIHNSPDTKIILVGNKCDLEAERQVSKEEAKNYAETYEFVNFFETSAKDDINIKEMFLDGAKILYNEFLKYSADKGDINIDDVNIVPDEKKEKKDEQRRKDAGCC